MRLGAIIRWREYRRPTCLRGGAVAERIRPPRGLAFLSCLKQIYRPAHGADMYRAGPARIHAAQGVQVRSGSASRASGLRAIAYEYLNWEGVIDHIVP